MSRRKLGPEEIQQLEDHVSNALSEQSAKHTQQAITAAIGRSDKEWEEHRKTLKRPKTEQLRRQAKNDFMRDRIAELLEASKILEGQALIDCVTSLAGFACNWTCSLDVMARITKREDTDHA